MFLLFSTFIFKRMELSELGADGAGVEDQPGPSGACNSTMMYGKFCHFPFCTYPR